MAIYLRQCFVNEEFAKKAPAQGVILREVASYYDQDGKAHVASIVQWYDTNCGIRYGAFDAKTGEYLGDLMTKSVRRHEDDCIGCLEPWDCDCECNTCKAARDNMGKKPELTEYTKYIKDILDPRD